jgi:signal transduction histidine kinase
MQQRIASAGETIKAFFEPNAENTILKQRGFILNVINGGIFLIMIAAAIVRSISLILYGPLMSTDYLLLIISMLMSIFGIGIYLVAKSGKVQPAANAFYCLLIVVVTFSAILEKMPSDRVWFIFILPIMIASFTAAPKHAFIAAGLSALAIFILDFFTLQSGANCLAVAIYFTVAAISFFIAQALNQTIYQLAAEDRIKTAFIQDTTHELRTPIGLMAGGLEMLTIIFEMDVFDKIDETVQEELTQTVGSMKYTTGRMSNLVNSLMASSIGAINDIYMADTIDISSLALKVFDEYRPKAKEKGLDLYITLANEEVLIRGNARQTRQMIVNLVDNAIKYTDEGKVELKIKKSSRNVEISISDTGWGIKQEDQSLVFTRLFRGKAEDTQVLGEGLGLSLVKEFVQTHNGEITLVSEPGKGSAFTVILPLKEEERGE